MNCLENMKAIAEKGVKVIEIEEAANELYAELEKIRNRDGELKNSTMDEEEDDNGDDHNEMNID
jgi:hypothetical protein